MFMVKTAEQAAHVAAVGKSLHGDVYEAWGKTVTVKSILGYKHIGQMMSELRKKLYENSIADEIRARRARSVGEHRGYTVHSSGKSRPIGGTGILRPRFEAVGKETYE